MASTKEKTRAATVAPVEEGAGAGAEEGAAPAAGDAEEDGARAAGGGEEEDTGAQFAPVVKLDEVAVSTGEEDEAILFEIKSKLYRFDKEGNQWKERGVGQVKLLEQRDTKRVRLLMRQSRTLKICANHTGTARACSPLICSAQSLSAAAACPPSSPICCAESHAPALMLAAARAHAVLPSISLSEHAGSDKSWVWHAPDFADGEVKDELFAMRFGSVESAQKFKTAFEDAQEKMEALLGDRDEAGGVAADDAAVSLESLKVGGSGEEPKEATDEPVATSAAAPQATAAAGGGAEEGAAPPTSEHSESQTA
eukprot:SM000021S06434  [mRNA]  locus=s21:193803:195118:- [translate_table: standard]